MQRQTEIAEDNASKLAYSLNTLLADEHLLYIKTRAAHWNVEGPDFYFMHKFFEEQYQSIETMIDEVAERIRTLGHYPEATLQGFLQLTHFTETRNEANNSTGFIKRLLEDHQSLISHLRQNMQQYAEKWKDGSNTDFLSNILTTHEKMAWMLKAHLG